MIPLSSCHAASLTAGSWEIDFELACKYQNHFASNYLSIVLL
jgi:hypothetical protein